ncbi:MAG TPA: LysM peptidoglycan-binding domain-containing protein [Steroidobacteraceae bacterium]|nr:LysM peptidoglycan-binding domain-containing protein [Steroidobacteraceae bacterium]
MFPNRLLSAGLTPSLVGALLISGCVFHHASTRVVTPAPTTVAETPAPSAGASETATEAAIPHADAAQAAADTAPAVAPASEPAATTAVARDEVNPTAPLRYTVKRGDTLWGIASMYLRDPWQWPEIWYVNPQIANPHLIFPGDVLALAYGSDGRAQVRLVSAGLLRLASSGPDVRLEPRLRSEPLNGAIPTIPAEAIAAFLSRPAILSTREVDGAPHVLAFRDEHQAGGTGDEAYVRNLEAPQGTRFLVMHVGEKVIDPDTGRVLGYQGLYTATATVARAGNPAKIVLAESARETLRGDCLFAETGVSPLTFIPRAPSVPVHGRIASVIDDVDEIGQYDIVALNRGTRDGVVPGTVLAVDRAGAVVADRGTSGFDMWGESTMLARSVRLPNERAGTVLVFKAYDDMSYALVVGSSEAMSVADIVRNP